MSHNTLTISCVARSDLRHQEATRLSFGNRYAPHPNIEALPLDIQLMDTKHKASFSARREGNPSYLECNQRPRPSFLYSPKHMLQIEGRSGSSVSAAAVASSRQ